VKSQYGIVTAGLTACIDASNMFVSLRCWGTKPKPWWMWSASRWPALKSCAMEKYLALWKLAP
jgi:hypothetical protein